MKTDNKKIYISLSIALGVILYHFAIWAFMEDNHNLSFTKILNNWDSGWYTIIVEKGYEGQSWAFYPLYPLFIFILSKFLPLEPQIIGSGISSIIFLTTVLYAEKFLKKRPEFDPGTLGRLLFLLSPASFIFHTHHTESLFLFLSVLAFTFAFEKKWIMAAVLAGLCALTRTQGVFLAVSIGLFAATQSQEKRVGLYRFLQTGIISGLIFLLFPAYNFYISGNAFSFLNAQSNWAHVESIQEWLATFYFGNEGQNTNIGSIIHHLWFAILAIASIKIWAMNRAIGLYCNMCVWVMSLQGELINSFRFAAVLFPIYFLLGKELERLPRWIQFVLLAVMLFINHQVTRNYALHRWAY